MNISLVGKTLQLGASVFRLCSVHSGLIPLAARCRPIIAADATKYSTKPFRSTFRQSPLKGRVHMQKQNAWEGNSAAEGRKAGLRWPSQPLQWKQSPRITKPEIIYVGRTDVESKPNARPHAGKRIAAAYSPAPRLALRAEASEKPVGPSVVRREMYEDFTMAHNSGMLILFLGTGMGHPSEHRRTSVLAMKLRKSTWLFDCGEDTQRQIHRQPLIKNGKLERIFITNRRANNLFGLPGMLCTMSASRDIGLDVADVPLHIYGPPGLAEYIRTMLQLSDTYISMPIIVHEFVDHAVDANQMMETLVNDRRNSLYRVLLPPDKLNPKGHYDGRIVPLLSRATFTTNKMAKGRDERLNNKPLLLPPPGNPAAYIEDDSELRWTVKTDDEQMVTAVRVPAEIESWAYVIEEADRAGTLDVEACRALSIPPRLYACLKEGRTVKNAHGHRIPPHQVVGPDKTGRRVVLVGESNDSACLKELAKGSDAIIHCASCQGTGENGLSMPRNTIDIAAKLASSAEAQHLLLYRFQPTESSQDSVALEGNVTHNEGSKTSPLPSLNSFDRLEWTKYKAYGGYTWRAKYSNPILSSDDAKAATLNFAADILRQKNRVSVTEDMALYSVERRK